MYLKALSNGSIVVDPGVEFLSIANIPTVVSVLCSKNELSYEMRWSEAQNNIDLPIVVKPVEVQTNIDLAIEVEPVEAQSNTDLPLEEQNDNGIPIAIHPFEKQNNDNLHISIEPIEVGNENQNQVWFTKYRKELQGLVITDREIESHYYEIHTALSNPFLKLNNSCAILILEGYIMVLIKQMNTSFLFDSHAKDSNGMPKPNGTCVVMKLTDISDLEQHLYFLSIKLNTNLFEIVPVQLIASETDSERKARLCEARQSKKQKLLEENYHNRQIRRQKDSQSKKRKRRSEETDSERQKTS